MKTLDKTFSDLDFTPALAGVILYAVILVGSVVMEIVV